MDVEDPDTWDDLAFHPRYSDVTFDPDWYDGDSKRDLKMLRQAAKRILYTFPDYECELCVLDDTTTFVEVESKTARVATVQPSDTDDYKRCYFLDVEGCLDEIRVMTVDDVIEVLQASAAGKV